MSFWAVLNSDETPAFLALMHLHHLVTQSIVTMLPPPPHPPRQDKLVFFFSCKKHLLGISFVTMETREDISGHPSVLPSLFPWGFVAGLCFCGCPVLHLCRDYPLPDKHFASREHALVIACMGVWLEKRMGKFLDGRVVTRWQEGWLAWWLGWLTLISTQNDDTFLLTML